VGISRVAGSSPPELLGFGIQLNAWAVVAPSLAVGLLATGITLATGTRRATATALAGAP
jgi:hypothetical protein